MYMYPSIPPSASNLHLSVQIYKNTELQALISALGLGTKGASLDPGRLRYGRVVLMTDADVDGSHIRMLLLTFLYRYQRGLIDAGHVYIACPPLFKVASKGKKGSDKYLFSQVRVTLSAHAWTCSYVCMMTVV
jgi:DNA gyrase subunit B